MTLLILPEDCKSIVRVKLPRPYDGKPNHYLYDEGNLRLYELVRYSNDFRSWFVDNEFIKEGVVRIATKIDPLFLLIPYLIKYTGDQKFRNLQDICTESSSDNPEGFSRIDYALSPDIEWDQVCESKEIDGELYVRYSKERTLQWLLKKHTNTMEAIKLEIDKNSSLATRISLATQLISDYLPETLRESLTVEVRRKFMG